jgi:cycloartenol synthase
MIPSWGKFWISVLGCHSWDGINPMPPEMWLLPYANNPLHPGRYWCHCRMVYLPMSYVYGRKSVGPGGPVVDALKQELYCTPYGEIDWNKARNQCAKEDLYYPHPLIQDLLWWACYKLEPLIAKTPLRTWALKEVCPTSSERLKVSSLGMWSQHNQSNFRVFGGPIEHEQEHKQLCVPTHVKGKRVLHL